MDNDTLPPLHRHPLIRAAISGRCFIEKIFKKINFLSGYYYATVILFSGAPGKMYLRKRYVTILF